MIVWLCKKKKIVLLTGRDMASLKKSEENLVDYLSCQIVENKTRDKIRIMQAHLENRLNENFGKEMEDKKVFKTPGLKGSRLYVKIMKLDEIILKISQGIAQELECFSI